MFVIFEGRSFDWEPMGYVESEEEAKVICEEHNKECMGHVWSESLAWYYLEVKSMTKDKIKDELSLYR